MLQQQALVNEAAHYSRKVPVWALANRCVLKIRLTTLMQDVYKRQAHDDAAALGSEDVFHHGIAMFLARGKREEEGKDGRSQRRGSIHATNIYLLRIYPQGEYC